MRKLTTQLKTLKIDMEEMGEAIDAFFQTASVPAIEKAPNQSAALKRSLLEQIDSLQSKLQSIRKPTLSDEDRTGIVEGIMDGLRSFDPAYAVRLASAEFNRQWFEEEPDKLLCSLVAKALINEYRSAGPLSLPIWEQQ